MKRSHLKGTAAVLGVASLLLLVGCTSNDGIAGEDGGGYISGDGTVLIIPAADRSEVPDWGGETVDGQTVDGPELGGVVVLNFWYAGCPPCRVEAPDLQAVHDQYGDEVTFLGVNTRDSAATAGSFEKEFGVEYDSILDVKTRDVLSAFADNVPPTAVPTTLILDAQGRVAARISGLLPSQTTLSDILDDVLAEL